MITAPGKILFVEVNHGPFLVENNFLLSATSLLNMSEGGAYAHNLMTGRVVLRPELSRATPFHAAHTTEVAGLLNIRGGDDRFYNNVLVKPASLSGYNNSALPVHMGGNVFLYGAEPSTHEQAPLVRSSFDPGIKLASEKDEVYLHIALDQAWSTANRCQLVTTDLLGKAAISDLPYERPDGSPIRVDSDYFGRKRNPDNPFPGPFEVSESGEQTGGKQTFKVWPVSAP